MIAPQRFVPSMISLMVLATMLGCVALGRRGAPTQLDPERLAELSPSVFEVVIPKGDDKALVYSDGRAPSPAELPFPERNDHYFSIGTAFFIGNGELVSAAHVFQLDLHAADRDIYVRDQAGKVYPVDTVRRFSEYRDLIVFTAKDLVPTAPALVLRDGAKVGERVYSVGDANGEGIAVRDGQVASYTFEPVAGAWRDLRFSAAASPGNSGGPLLDATGAVVGIVTRKSESENLNVAVPVSELAHLANDKAEFFVASIEANVDPEPVADWHFTAPLPSTLAVLGAKAEADRRAFHLGQWRKAMKDHAAHVFPQDPELAPFVLGQSYSPLIKTLSDGGDDGYRMIPEEPLRQRTTTRNEVVSVMQDDADNRVAQVELPDGMDISGYVHSPARIMDALVEGFAYVRDFHGRKLPLKSLGTPVSTGRFVDKLGRPWVKATWHTWYNEGSLLINCLPAPSGFGCVFDDVATSDETFGLQEKFEEYYAGLMMMSYRGTQTAWQHFLSQDQALLPQALRDLKINLDHGSIEFIGGDFHLRYPQPLASSASVVFVGLGYGMKSVEAPEIQSLRFDHGSSLAVSEQFDLAVEPPADATPDDLKAWKRLTAGHGRGGSDNDSAVHRLLSLSDWSQGRKVAQTVECRGPGRRPAKAQVQTCDQIQGKPPKG